MKKRMIIMLLAVFCLFAIVFGYKFIRGQAMSKYMAKLGEQRTTVSTIKVVESEWQPQFKAVGNVRAVQGVSVTTELAGMVKKIYFTPGTNVQAGEVLVELNIAPDVAQLHQLEANAELAAITYHRDKEQYAIHAISGATLDTDRANLKSAIAQVEQQQAIIEQKIIRAPFNGRLGINQVNVGQYLNPGDAVTLLESLDPIYVDFYVPQQWVDEIKMDQVVNVDVDAFKGEHFAGKITTINPSLDASVRNLQVEATLLNPDAKLLPGMFATITVNTGLPENHLTIPQTAVSFNPYGSTVFLVQETGETVGNTPTYIAKQIFVETGNTRGDQVQILKGLKAGDTVVTSGQLKLRNGSRIVINNSVQPTDSASNRPIETS